MKKKYRMIAEIMDNFNFEEVHQVFIKMWWKYFIWDISISQLKHTAEHCINSAIRTAKENWEWYCSTWRFVARAMYENWKLDWIALEFTPIEWESFRNEI